MKRQPGFLGLLVLLAASFAMAMAFSASAAQADTGDIIEEQHTPPNAKDGFQAGTCVNDGPEYPIQCSPDSPPAQWYTVAGGHPNIGFTQYIVKHTTAGPLAFPVGSPKTIRVDLPPGLTVNPQATAQCPLAVFKADETNCPPSSEIGQEEVTVAVAIGGLIEFPPGSGEFLPQGAVLPPMEGGLLNTLVPIYNIEPVFGEAARFGFKIGTAKTEVYLEGDVDWSGDYHQGFTINLPPPNPLVKTLKSRLVNFGKSGNGTYISNPTTCFDPKSGAYTTRLRADSVEDPNPNFPVGQTPWEAGLPPGVQQEACETVPFDPSLNVQPGTNQVDSPAAPEVKVVMPFEPDENGQERSHVRDASVTLPAGMGLNPSAANFILQSCTNAQFGKGTRNPVSCPPGSKIGTAHVETQPLPPNSLNGDVYLAQQQGFNPESGNMYRIFINPVSARYGVDVRLVGNIRANRVTGQLTAVLAENPQVPFESVTLRLDPAKQALTSPPTCGSHQTTSSMEPWARPGTFVHPASSFGLTAFPGGGACPATLAERPFDPGYSAGPTRARAGAFSPFKLRLTRPDGAQEFRQVNVKLPPGMVAKLRNLDYCPEKNIAEAAAQPGTNDVATPPCPDRSFLGTSTVAAGSGPQPFQAAGNVYLAGPYKGAPVSLVFMTPAVAAAFDLGTVVVRTALHVHPETVRVTAVSDPIPHVFGGAKLGIRQIDVSIFRKGFTINPTSCRKGFRVAASVFGGGGDPDNAASWSRVERANAFRARRCGALRFKPRFNTRIFGGKKQTRRAANPKFRAIFWGRYGDANLRRAAFVLPRATILDQSHIRTICTRVQLAAKNCPKGAIYGFARARSPLLSAPLKGPVYLTSSNNPLPDLLVDLRGQVNVQLRGVISSKGARLSTVFRRVPDVPVRKFVLTMRGGNRGLLVNSQNLCDRPRFGTLNLKAQNGKQMRTNRQRLRIDACRGGRN